MTINYKQLTKRLPIPRLLKEALLIETGASYARS